MAFVEAKSLEEAKRKVRREIKRYNKGIGLTYSEKERWKQGYRPKRVAFDFKKASPTLYRYKTRKSRRKVLRKIRKH